MTVKVRIPAALRTYVGGQSAVEVPASTVGEALQALVGKHAALRSHLFESSGELRGFVGVYVNQQDIRGLQGERTPLKPEDVVVLLPSVAGGSA